MKKAKTHTPSPWVSVTESDPPAYTNVLMAFEHQWNQVVGFRQGDGWYETSADDFNRKCKSAPTWWAPIPEVPNHP